MGVPQGYVAGQGMQRSYIITDQLFEILPEIVKDVLHPMSLATELFAKNGDKTRESGKNSGLEKFESRSLFSVVQSKTC